MMGPELTAAESAIYESLVVSRYMQAFGEPSVPMLIQHTPARIAHLNCRTGYPAQQIEKHLRDSAVMGADSSEPALELARTKARLLSNLKCEYVHATEMPTPLPGQRFTHAYALHPLATNGSYGSILSELYRVLMPGGQMVMSLPLRGSFPEVYDMLREYALRHDRPHFGEAVDLAASNRPNPETVVGQVEAAGFYEVDVGVELVAISFENGRDFLEDPIARLVVGPDIVTSLAVDVDFDDALAYATEAISMYWSEITFELTVNIGSVSARKP